MAMTFHFDPLPEYQSLRVELTDATSVGAARRACDEMASHAHLDDAQRGRLGLIITEAANNVINHAERGEIILRRGSRLIDMLVLDKGPGMANVERCMADGFSTGGTRGAGLSSLQRQADVFAIDSRPPVGTAIFARVGKSAYVTDVGAVCLPLAGETQCGDAWVLCEEPAGEVRLVVSDGLGHGPVAADASRAIIEEAPRCFDVGPQTVLERVHAAASSTRGAAVSVADLMVRQQVVTFTGVGNVGGTVVTVDKAHSLTAHNGIVGVRMPRVQTFSYPWLPENALVLYSDGLQSRWSLQAYPGLLHKPAALIAGVLYRDFARGRDDVTVVVLKQGAWT